MNLKTSLKTIVRKSLSFDEEVVVGENEQLTYVFFIDKEKSVDCNLSFFLAGEGSVVKVIGFTLSAKYQSIVNLRTIHQNKNTTGYIWVTSILSGNAQTKVKGMIEIDKNTSWAKGYFTHNSLLLSPTAKVATSPALEIKTNEVKASHQATIGHLDTETLFYLQARGIPPMEAKKLVLSSFAHEYLSEISNALARKEVSKYVNKIIGELV